MGSYARLMQQEITTLELSPDQQTAFDTITKWISIGGSQELSMGGYAGTGKTTLLKKIIGKNDEHVKVMSLTGKAVSVLIKKGMDAATIHSTIYRVHLDEKKKPVFTLRDYLDESTELFIIDEASMVSTDLYTDLLSFAIPILWVGDHGQLEPIGKNPGVMKDPDIRLEKIHRQAAENPVIMFCDKLRRGAHPTAIADVKDEEFVHVRKKTQLNDSLFDEVNQIIVAFNRTRVKINILVRKHRSLDIEKPVVGDRVVCLKNRRQEGLFNGLQGVIKAVSSRSDKPSYFACITLDNGREWQGEILSKQFNHVKGLVDVDPALWRATHWDYAYAITCHKAQGSEWPHVLVIEEGGGKLWSMARWRYTAATRSQEKLTYAC